MHFVDKRCVCRFRTFRLCEIFPADGSENRRLEISVNLRYLRETPFSLNVNPTDFNAVLSFGIVDGPIP